MKTQNSCYGINNIVGKKEAWWLDAFVDHLSFHKVNEVGMVIERMKLAQ